MSLLDLINYFLLTLFLGTITFSIGHLVLSIFKTYLFEHKFLFYFKLVVGVVLLVSIYALVKSHFHSYLLIVIPISVVLIYFFRKSLSFSGFWLSVKIIPFKQLGLFFGFLFIAFLLAAVKVVNINLQVYQLHPDFSYYSAISEILYAKGIESNYFDIAQIGERHYTFYHYFESWLNAFLFEFTANLCLYNLMLVVFPFFMALSCLGVYFLIKSYISEKGNLIVVFVLSFIVLFIAPFISTIRWLLHLSGGELPWNSSIWSSQSIKSVVVLFGLNFCFLLYKNYPRYVIMSFIVLTVIYPSLLVVIISSLIFWFILWYKSLKNDQPYQQSLILLLALIIGFGFVLYINQNSSIYTTSISKLSFEYFSANKSLTFNVLKDPLLRTIWMIITYFPFLLVGILLYKNNLKESYKKHKSLLFFLSIAYVLGVSGITLVSFMANADQLFKNLFEPLLVLLTALLLIKGFYFSSKLGVKIVSIVVLLASFLFSFPDIIKNRDVIPKEYTQMAKLLSPYLKNTAFIKGGKLENGSSFNIYFLIPYYNLRGITNNYFPKCLSLKTIPTQNIEDRAYALNCIQNSLFYESQIKQQKSYQETIDQYKISAIFIENNAEEIGQFKADKQYSYYYFQPYSLFIKK